MSQAISSGADLTAVSDESHSEPASPGVFPHPVMASGGGPERNSSAAKLRRSSDDDSGAWRGVLPYGVRAVAVVTDRSFWVGAVLHLARWKPTPASNGGGDEVRRAWAVEPYAVRGAGRSWRSAQWGADRRRGGVRAGCLVTFSRRGVLLPSFSRRTAGGTARLREA